MNTVAARSASGSIGAYRVMVAIFLVAAAVRIIPLQYSHSWDEAAYLQHAKIVVEGRTNYSELDRRPPLLPLFYALGFLVWRDVYVAHVIQGILTALVVP